MRYVVLTTKHHDGFCMWPTATTDFHIGNTRYGGDLVGEYVEATRAAGLHVGLYYSLADWHHPDYPAFTDEMGPYPFIAYPRPGDEAWGRFTDTMFEQLRELLTGYGPIDLLWFDGGWERTAEEWRASELERFLRQLQPDLLINDRLPGAGDYVTPEQFVPPEAPGERWETCLTMNETWGWCPDDTEYKSATALVHTVCEVAGRGGNLLLNVSPMADGHLPTPQLDRLEAIGRWMYEHGGAIHDTVPGLEPWQFYGPSTRRGDRIYLHLLMRPYESVTVRGIPIRRVENVYLVGSGAELEWRGRCSVLDELLNADPIGEIEILLSEEQHDDLATVIAIDVRGAGST
jgi:alpha-L-fucosidase